MRRRSAALIVLAAVVLSAACASEADRSIEDVASGTGDAPASDDGAGGAAGARGTIDWSPCGRGECAEVEVPLDYDDPRGATIDVSVLRVPATGDRIGPLFVNPGGPGGTATDFAADVATVLPSEITERFDIVGVDPRGLGASSISCDGDMYEVYGVDYSIDSPEDTSTLLDVSQDYVDGCARNGGDLLAHVSTENVARDIDAVRAAMGDDQLNYLGYSYGTAIGQLLAEVAPGQVRTMVLDGIVDLGPTGIEAATTQAAGFETALRSFADDCDADPSCPIAPDAIGAIEQLQAEVEQAPIPGDGRDLGPGQLSTALPTPLYSEDLWPDLSAAVADALDGDPSGMLALEDQYLRIADFDIYFAVNCLDWAWPDDPQVLLDAGTAAADESPHFGESLVNDYVRCTMWPVEDDAMPAVTAPDAPPVLVVSTTNDPATPYESGVRTAERLATGVLVTYEGDGHTVVGNGVPCIDDLVASYVVDVEVPEDGTTC
jgi:pimeloyl-ACP methyl ester carboxylesterase